jgi:hypothetical protein
MKTDFRSLPWQCLTAVGMLPLVALPSKALAASSAEVSCATPDMWTGAARISKVTPRQNDGAPRVSAPEYAALMDDATVVGGVRTATASVGSTDAVAEDASWRSTYRGQGLGRTKGWARARILRRGVLWSVDPRDLGVTQRQAGAALLREGASTVFYRRDGLVVFRAPASSRDSIAGRAAARLGASASAPAATASAGRTSHRAAAVQRAASVSIDVAMMRVEGSYSNGPTGFIDALPGGMFVYPFGTSFVVYVPRERVDDMWNAIDGEGHRVLMVGASSSPASGSQAASAVQFCGGAALMKRFPTPRVVRSDRTGVVMELESQALGAQVGDVVMVVQAPPYGRGMELALMRVVAR